MFARGSVWPVLLVYIHKMAGVNKVIVTTSTPRCSRFFLSTAHALSSQGLERAVAVGVDKRVTDTREKTHRAILVLLCIDALGWKGFGPKAFSLTPSPAHRASVLAPDWRHRLLRRASGSVLPGCLEHSV